MRKSVRGDQFIPDLLFLFSTDWLSFILKLTLSRRTEWPLAPGYINLKICLYNRTELFPKTVFNRPILNHIKHFSFCLLPWENMVKEGDQKRLDMSDFLSQILPTDSCSLLLGDSSVSSRQPMTSLWTAGFIAPVAPWLKNEEWITF